MLIHLTLPRDTLCTDTHRTIPNHSNLAGYPNSNSSHSSIQNRFIPFLSARVIRKLNTKLESERIAFIWAVRIEVHAQKAHVGSETDNSDSDSDGSWEMAKFREEGRLEYEENRQLTLPNAKAEQDRTAWIFTASKQVRKATKSTYLNMEDQNRKAERPWQALRYRYRMGVFVAWSV